MDAGAISAYTDFIKTQNTADAKLKEKIDGADYSKASDKELMDVCKDFEAYFTEQMFKAMQKMIPESEEVSSYTRQIQDYYKEQMVQSFADQSANGDGLGIAQMLYEQMKRNYGLE